MGFLQKIDEAYRVQADIVFPLKPIKITQKPKDDRPHGKSKKARAPRAPGTSMPKAAEGKEKVGFTELTNTRKLTPFIQQELELTDPFNFTNETWTRFTKNVVPKLLMALLLDMNIVPKSKKAEFVRYLTRRLRTLAKD